MIDPLRSTRVWAESRELPATLQATLDERDGFGDLASLLVPARRIVATGNGAAYYAALTLWLASLEGRTGPEVVAVPAGLLAQQRLTWRAGDVLLVVSSSGELRDAVEALAAGAPRPYGAVTSSPGSTIAAGAGARALARVESQEAVTHTQAHAGNVLATLAVWAAVTGDGALAMACAEAPTAVAAAVAAAEGWIAGATAGLDLPAAAVAFGSGTAWPAALEAALLLKEVARVPAEGLETREGATSGMYALDGRSLALSLPAGPDPLLEEAEENCAATGARLLRLPGGDLADRRLAPLATFPAAVALATVLGLRAGHDVDRPGWTDAYYATARVGGTKEA